METRQRTGIFPVLFFLLVILGGAREAPAQFVVRSWLPWRTIETRDFAFHYPVELEAWTQSLASRADAIDSSVAAITGYVPSRKTHVVVDDPYNTANGSAWPFLDRPVINLWATPPDPRSDIGEFRDWGRTLLSHEFAHIAHLSRPSRNGRLRRLWQLAPVDLGPITLNAPRWVIEGFATYAEGKVTGSGRPHGSWRPAYLRQWALEGQLPRYEQLDSFGSFDGGEFAYLAGSAFLEWLAARQGDSSLVAVWRRMTAKQPRAFEEAFAGVFGESARTLYGRFTTELTGKSLEVERRLRAAFPADTGDVVQRLAWGTGDPAISRDGKRVAIALASPTAPSRIVIWNTAAEPDTGRARRDSMLRKSDPDDVPARVIHPPPKRVLATLRAPNGAAYESPRFLPDGRVLVARYTRVGDGSLRPDLYVWDPQRRTVRRMTHGAAIRAADPSPDGKQAIGMQCRHGWCDVALVDLVTGADSVILRGSPERSYFRPRYAPDGRRFVVSRSENGRWRLVVAGSDGGTEPAELELPFRGNAYDGAWVGPNEIVATADGDGIPNLQRIDLTTRATQTLTHVTGAAVGAERNPADGSIWFLSLYSRGYDLRRTSIRRATDSVTVAADERLAPASAIPPTTVPEFPVNAVSAPRPYEVSPRLFRWLPLPQADADGASGVLGLVSGDVIGRSELLAKIAIGDRAAWRGASIDATWRGFRPFIKAGAFVATQSLDASRSAISGAAGARIWMHGGMLTLDGSRAVEAWAARYRVGASAARVTARIASRIAANNTEDSWSSRSLLFGDLALSSSQRLSGASSLSESLGGNVTAGRSFGTPFYRAVTTGALSANGFTPVPVAATATYARTSDDAPAFERLSLGGGPPALVDRLLLSQRMVMPVLPSGIATGTSAFIYKISLITQPLNIYYWAGSTAAAGSRFADWHRVIGLEGSQAVAAIPVAALPSARAVYGIGESLDAPFRRKIRAYVSLVLSP